MINQSIQASNHIQEQQLTNESLSDNHHLHDWIKFGDHHLRLSIESNDGDIWAQMNKNHNVYSVESMCNVEKGLLV